MKPAILLPVRNKAAYIERCLRACLAQTVPVKIIIFGPENTDGTDEVIKSVLGITHKEIEFPVGWPVADMNPDDSPHRVIWHRTPDNGYAGMNLGMNSDFNWIHLREDFDVGLFCSADDMPEPTRVERVMWAFETFKPSWVVNRQVFKREDGSVFGESSFPDRYSRWISVAEAIMHQIGSSGGFAWSKDLYDKYAPVVGIESNDVMLPIMALMERGMYYIDEPLHTMYLHDDLDNLGLEGQMRGARNEAEGTQLLEVNNYHNVSNWCAILRRLQDSGHAGKLSPEAVNALHGRIVGASDAWARARDHLTVNKIKPLAFGARALGIE